MHAPESGSMQSQELGFCPFRRQFLQPRVSDLVAVRCFAFADCICFRGNRGGLMGLVFLVAEWIHFTLFGIILPTINLKVYTSWGL